MTYQEFLQALEKTPRDWFVSVLIDTFSGPVSGAIRCEGPWIRGEMCPLTSVCQSQSGVAFPLGFGEKKAATTLELSEVDCRRIVNAADNVPGHDQIVRADLLRACGLNGDF